MEKKLRFGDLVRKAGRPQVVTLWTDPRRDRSFTRAIQQNRVLTVLRQPATQHADFGNIGFQQQREALYLVFPRPLPENRDSRVVGINYQLLEEPEAPGVKPAPAKREKPPPKPKPVGRRFTIKVRRTATLESDIEVDAENRQDAEKRAMQRMEREPFRLNQAAIHDAVVRIE